MNIEKKLFLEKHNIEIFKDIEILKRHGISWRDDSYICLPSSNNERWFDLS